jgi:hypothetical protein
VREVQGAIERRRGGGRGQRETGGESDLCASSFCSLARTCSVSTVSSIRVASRLIH